MCVVAGSGDVVWTGVSDPKAIARALVRGRHDQMRRRGQRVRIELIVTLLEERRLTAVAPLRGAERRGSRRRRGGPWVGGWRCVGVTAAPKF